MPSDLITESAIFQNFLVGMPPDTPRVGMPCMHVCFVHIMNVATTPLPVCIHQPLKMPDHLFRGCSSPVSRVDLGWVNFPFSTILSDWSSALILHVYVPNTIKTYYI